MNLIKQYLEMSGQRRGAMFRLNVAGDQPCITNKGHRWKILQQTPESVSEICQRTQCGLGRRYEVVATDEGDVVEIFTFHHSGKQVAAGQRYDSKGRWDANSLARTAHQQAETPEQVQSPSDPLKNEPAAQEQPDTDNLVDTVIDIVCQVEEPEPEEEPLERAKLTKEPSLYRALEDRIRDTLTEAEPLEHAQYVALESVLYAALNMLELMQGEAQGD